MVMYMFNRGINHFRKKAAALAAAAVISLSVGGAPTAEANSVREPSGCPISTVLRGGGRRPAGTQPG